MRKKISSILLIASVFTFVAFGFQNCGSGFQVSPVTSSPSSSNLATPSIGSDTSNDTGAGSPSVPSLDTTSNGGPSNQISFTNIWHSLGTDDNPALYYLSRAVWTGSKMIAFGNTTESNVLGAAVYDPGSSKWISAPNAPSSLFPSKSTLAAWTGTRALIWDPATHVGYLYDPKSENWAPLSTVGAPNTRENPAVVWTGNKIVVWGGHNIGMETPINNGAIYDPATDLWTPISNVGAPTYDVTGDAVWTGDKMFVFEINQTNSNQYFATIKTYDPATDRWASISAINPPTNRKDCKLIWTGSKILMWGGSSDKGTSGILDGSSFDPLTNAWTPISKVGAPETAFWNSAVWTGSRLIIWGGVRDSSSPPLNTGAVYDPANNSWTATSSAGAPTARIKHEAVWTGSEMLIWGGGSLTQRRLNSGASLH